MTNIFFTNIPEYNGIGIYQITNRKNGKKYIGSSINVQKRILQHLQSFKKLQCPQKFIPDLQNDALFSVEILETFPFGTDEFTLRKRENYYIIQTNACKTGYNSGFVGYFSPERNRRIYPPEKNNVKSSTLKFSKEKYEEIKAAATAAGESVNGYIKKAIDERMERDNA